MDCLKTGKLIRSLRKENHLTQLMLADMLNISDKAVSKWERGAGFPDVELVEKLSEIFKVDLSGLILGELKQNDPVGGNMKKTKFYVCPHCFNVICAAQEASITCCGKKLDFCEAKQAEGNEDIRIEKQQNEYLITSEHEMTKEHYISFVALLSPDTLIMKRLYPQWDINLFLPRIGGGILLWYCSKNGLYAKEV